MGACCQLWLAVILLMWLVVGGAVTLPRRAAGAPSTTCELLLEGFRPASGLKVAKIVCAGGAITAAAHPTLLSSTQAVFKGVKWSTEVECSNLNSKCLLALCGDSSLVFHNPTVTHVNASALQAVVCVGGNSTAVIEGGRFVANTGTPLGVVGTGAGVVVKHSTFSNNVLLGEENEDAPRAAAAMFMEGGLGMVESSMFSGNSAGNAGGAIGLQGAAWLDITNTTFKNNTGLDGGAVLADGSALVAIEHSILDHNEANFGGSIYLNSQSQGEIISCNITNNVARTSGGGAYATDSSTVNITSTTFRGNKAGSHAGGLGLWSQASAKLHGSIFRLNRADEWGGGICMGSGTTLQGTGSALHNNTATYGGALYMYGHAAATLQNVSMVANSASDDGGGAYLWDDALLHVYGGEMLGNFATNAGGFLGAGNHSTALLVASYFDQNSAIEKGGVYKGEGRSNTTFKRCEVHGRVKQPKCFGGAFLINSNAHLVLDACHVSNYTADKGGGVATFTNGHLRVINTVFEDLHATPGNGGGVYAVHESNVEWFGGRIAHCTAPRGGCAWLSYNASGSFEGVEFVNCTAESRGGAVSLEDDARLRMTHCKVQGCMTPNYGGGLYLRDTCVANLTDCSFEGCVSETDGGGLIAWDNSAVHLQGCRFVRNKAGENGGGLEFNGGELDATDTWLLNNAAKKQGGGMHTTAGASVKLTKCAVSANSAHAGGGIWVGDTSVLSLSRTKVSGNSASGYGGGVVLQSGNFVRSQVEGAASGNRAKTEADIAVWPTTITSLNDSTVENFVSRLNSEEGVVDVLLQVTGAQGLPSEGVVVVASLGGVNLKEQATGNDGTAFLPVKLRKPPCTYILNFSIPTYASVPPINMTVHVVNCSLGDVTVSSRDACQTCTRGSFSMDPRNSTCDQCVPNAECLGGYLVLPLPGFWKSAPSSIQMHRCFNADACPGVTPDQIASAQAGTKIALQGTPAPCAPEYTGHLSAMCANGFGVVRPFVCRKCLKAAQTIWLYVLAALVMLVATRVLSALSLADPGPSAPNQIRPVDLCKPLVIYAQYLFIIFSLNGVQWPVSLSNPMQALAWFWSSASSNSLGLDCILSRSSAVPVPVQKVVLGLCVPLVILFVLMIAEFLWWACRASRISRRGRARGGAVTMVSVRDRFVSLFVCMAFLFLPTWMHTVFSLFTCVPLDEPAAWPYAAHAVGSFWAQDMNERCYAPRGYHRSLSLKLGIPLLLLLCFVLPVGLAAFLQISKMHGQLGRGIFRRQYGFLYRTWRKDVCWYEAIVVVQTMQLVMIGTFGYALGPFYQLLVMATALGLIGVLLLLVKPHSCAAAGAVCIQSVGVLYATTFAALSFLPYRNITPPAPYTVTMGALLLFINVAFVLCTLFKLLRLVDWAACCCCIRRMGSRAAACFTAAPALSARCSRFLCPVNVPSPDAFHFPHMHATSCCLVTSSKRGATGQGLEERSGDGKSVH